MADCCCAKACFAGGSCAAISSGGVTACTSTITGLKQTGQSDIGGFAVCRFCFQQFRISLGRHGLPCLLRAQNGHFRPFHVNCLAAVQLGKHFFCLVFGKFGGFGTDIVLTHRIFGFFKQ